MSEGLFVRELFGKTIDKLVERNQGREIVLAEKAYSEVGNDSDWHRSRVGYMVYEKVNLIELGRTWAIGLGTPSGYPAEKFSSDILALDFDTKKKTEKQIQEELKKRIERDDYFKNTLLFGLYGGQLGGSKRSPFMDRLFESIGGFSEFVTQICEEEVGDRRLYHMDLRPVMKQSTKYKPEFAGFLAEKIEAVLKETK